MLRRTLHPNLTVIHNQLTTIEAALGDIVAFAELMAAAFRVHVVDLGSIVIGTTEIPVTWTSPFGDSSYAVVPTITVTTAVIGSLTAAVKDDSKTALGCVIIVRNSTLATIAAGLALNVIAIWPAGLQT